MEITKGRKGLFHKMMDNRMMRIALPVNAG